MTPQTKQPAISRETDLAARIYTDLVCRNLLVAEGAAKMKASPESLARTSFQLAEVFLRVDAERNASNAPKNQSFDMQDVDLANWNPGQS